MEATSRRCSAVCFQKSPYVSFPVLDQQGRSSGLRRLSRPVPREERQPISFILGNGSSYISSSEEAPCRFSSIGVELALQHRGLEFPGDVAQVAELPREPGDAILPHTASVNLRRMCRAVREGSVLADAQSLKKLHQILKRLKECKTILRVNY